ncbi:PREDICTED: scm-like with four MBT domains protein 2 [Priapulus caudatus]|uniref:Scm-like with four MBT domains protein 2 n=1 Tax=Priapulus caudatus TaxID=37621 RepID=A0ABM1EWU7_PRICU|nr:PREDICTED: scm-like with four MBT domains protein 2 [Priapulus caudatus]
MSNSSESIPESNSVGGSTYGRREVVRKPKAYDQRPKMLRRKRKYDHFLPPRTEMVTRGAKLPKYTFEKRTHQKILAEPINIKVKSPPAATQLPKKPRGRPPLNPRRSVEDAQPPPPQPQPQPQPPQQQQQQQQPTMHVKHSHHRQEIDGQALLLLNLPTVQEHLELKLGPAVKLCHHIERVKVAFFAQFAK